MALYNVLTESGNSTGFQFDEADGLVEHYLDYLNLVGGGSFTVLLVNGSKSISPGPIGNAVPLNIRNIVDQQVANGIFTGIPSNTVTDEITGAVVVEDVTQTLVLAG